MTDDQQARDRAIETLADITYRGKDTGHGFARVIVEAFEQMGWTPPLAALPVAPEQSTQANEGMELDHDALTAAHVAVEDVLIGHRDSRFSMPMCANGFVVKEKDGSSSEVIRLGTRIGLSIGIKAYLAALVSSPSVETVTPEGLSGKLATLSRWIDDGNAHRDQESREWGRLAKIAEENGEVIAAYIGATGQNPRKGVTHTQDDVLAELLDVAVTALGAWESLTGNRGTVIEHLDAKLDMILDRAGLRSQQGGQS